MIVTYRCSSCGSIYKEDGVVYRCPACTEKSPPGQFQKGNLLVEMDMEPRNKPAFPINPLTLFPYPVPQASVFPAGNTPLITAEQLSKEYAIPGLRFKLETGNPSGSYKDRASLLVAAQAAVHDENTVVLASTGNAGSAMSCAGAALGLDVILFVPASAPREKLAQSLFYGALVIPVDGNYDDAFSLSIEYSSRFGGINRNTGYNPMTIEGKKSAAVELYNQYGGTVPDTVYIPSGDGVIYTGIAKGFEDLYRLGLISSLPRCVAVQAEGSNAIARSFAEGKEIVLERTATAADSISVCSPACGEPALQYLQKTKGWCTEVSDTEIFAAQKELAEKAGAFVEPSSAAVWAGIKKDRAGEILSGDENIAAILTGSGFKDMNPVLNRITIPDPVANSIDAAVHYLDSIKSRNP